VSRQSARTAAQRKADTLAKLTAPAADIWVASASGSGAGAAEAHLVPLSFGWVSDRIVLAVEAYSRTARNLVIGRRARLGLGPTRDVVMIDADVVAVLDAGTAPAGVADGYAAQADWDPRAAGPGYVYLVLSPTRIQAWREANELRGRTLMRDGQWFV